MGFWDWLDKHLLGGGDHSIGGGGRLSQVANQQLAPAAQAQGQSVEQYKAQQAQRETADAAKRWQQASQNPINQFIGGATGVVFDTVSTGANAIRWTYNNAISQPLTTAILMGNKANPDSGEFGLGHPGVLFDGDQWSRSWHAAEHISPGQAILLRGATLNSQGQLQGFGGHLGNPSAAQAIEAAAPAYVTPDKSLLPAEFGQWDFSRQQQYLKQVGMPISGNALIEQYRQDNTFFKHSSGAIDFGINWYLDPFVLGGKALSTVKRVKVTQPAPIGGWSNKSIQDLVNDSKLVKARDWMWENRDNPQLVNNLSFAQKSALGPRFGAILQTLKSPDEVTDFIKVTMGDSEAQARLAASNAAARAAIEQDTARLSSLGLMRSKYTNPNLQALVDKHMDRLNAGIAANTAMVQRYDNILAHYGEVDSINLTKWSTQAAERRTAAQAAYQAGTARRAGLPIKQRIYPGTFFGTPMNIVRGFNNYRPNGWIALDDLTDDTVREVRGQIARIPGIGPDIRQSLLNQYLKTTDSTERLAFLQQLDGFGVEQLAKRFGLSPEDAKNIYAAHQGRMDAEKEKMLSYSGSSRLADDGTELRADAFHDAEGGIKLAPNMVTKLQNTHVALDLDAYAKALSRHAADDSELKALRQAIGKGADIAEHGAEWLNDLWKFGTLFRLGYVPRVLADDLAGQVARLGAASMALRFGYGVKNAATNLANSTTRGFHAAGEMAAKQGIEYIDNELAVLAQDRKALGLKIDNETRQAEIGITNAERRLQQAQNRVDGLSPTARPSTRNAAQALLLKRERELRQAERAHTQVTTTLTPARVRSYDTDLREKWLNDLRAQAEAKLKYHQDARTKQYQGGQGFAHRGQEVPGAFEGQRGDFWRQSVSSEQTIGNIFTQNKQLIHGNLMRSFNHGGMRVAALENEELHAGAWAHAINAQIMQDELGRMAVKLIDETGGDEAAAIDKMAKWLRNDPAGKAYRKRLGVAHDTPEYIAGQIWHEASDYLPTPEIRAQAQTIHGVDPEFLKQAMPKIESRPEVHMGQLGESLAGKNPYRRAVDRVMGGFYKTAATIPADRMSRHPLFNQLYMGHAKRLINQELMNRGVTKLEQGQVDQLVETSRRLAARDMRKLVFDISHRSDVTAALRFISPFFAATTESWQRWARIIGDKPQTVGYAAKFFTWPLATGHAVDQDGNVLDQWGRATDPATGKKTEVPKSERRILVRMPKWIARGPIGQALGMDASGSWLVSQDSMNMITQGDPWFNPGTGPMVQIPVNELVKNKPTEAEVARHLGILPFGPQGGASDFLVPRTFRDLATAFDSSDERYQAVRLQFLQRAAYEHQELGKPMPSLAEIDKRVRHYWLWTASASFSQPFSTAKRDPYQFYRDQYNSLMRKHAGNSQAVDNEFIDRYGESFLVFAQSMSDNRTGVAATKKAALLYQQHQDLIDKHPELAALIVGPDGNGPFSPEAYAYQLNSPVVTGGGEMQRSKMTADQAMKENQKRRGWDDFTRFMNSLNAIAVQRGANSLNDPGNEDLVEAKRLWVADHASPYLADGSANPNYNAQWAQDYTSFNSQKYEQLMPALRAVAYSPLAQQRQRSDLRMLQNYLQVRDYVTQTLAQRQAEGGNATLTARANADLLGQWNQAVGAMIEQDTRFGDLWSRYLTQDLGVNVQEGEGP